MKKIYRNIGLALGMMMMISCSNDPLQEDASFIPENPDKDGEKLPPNEQWAWVGAYPGEVVNSVQRLSDVQVKVNGNYEIKDLKFLSKPGYLQSSGLYVPPAEKIIVNFPGGADNLHYQVGIASWELPAGGQYSRYEKVSVNGELTVGENVIYTNFGGHLYFYFDGAPQTTEVTLTVSGAVKSLDYILDETELQGWRDAVVDSVSPMIWGELTGKRVIMTLPLAALKQIERPDILLKYYDSMFEKDLDLLGGVESTDFSMPWRVYSDVQLPNNAAGATSKLYPFYPMGFLSNTSDSLQTRLVGLFNANSLKDSLLIQGFADLYAMNWSSSEYIGKFLRKMPVYHYFQRLNKWNELISSFSVPKAVEKRYNLPGDKDKLSMVVQLVQQYGWNLLKYIAEKSRQEIPQEVPDQYKNDLLAMYSCEYAGADLTEFFDGWGFPVSMYGRNYMSHYPAIQDKFWETAVPATQPQDGPGASGSSYEKIWPVQDTVYKAVNWVGTASSTAEGSVSNLVDKTNGTIWHSSWAAGVDYPHWFQFDFPEPMEFNYVYMVQRQHENPGPKSFKILIRTEADSEDWTEADHGRVFYICHTNKGYPIQRNFLNDVVRAYAVRIMLLSGHDWSEGDNVKKNYAALDEFAIGLLK